MSHFGISYTLFLKSWDVQHDIFSHCHYRFNSYLSYWSLCYICKFNAVCFLILLTAWKYKRPTSYLQNINIKKIYMFERARIFSSSRIYAFQNSYFFQFWVGTYEVCLHIYIHVWHVVGYSECYIDLYTFNAVSLLYRVAQKPGTVDFQDFALINSYLFSPCWIEHLFLIIITPWSSNLVENFLFYE